MKKKTAMKRSRRQRSKIEQCCSRESKAHQNDGIRLRMIRRSLHKTQKEFAAELGISMSTLANYENARTEMPPSFARAVLRATGLNPVPLDPEQDPKLLLQLKVTNAVLPPKPLYVRIQLLRRRCIAIRNEVYTPMRLMIDNAFHVAFSIAALVFAVEQLRRLPSFGAQDPSLFRDITLVGALLTIIALIIPIVQSIPWGIRAQLSRGS